MKLETQEEGGVDEIKRRKYYCNSNEMRETIKM
jgi:hypothetical protein